MILQFLIFILALIPITLLTIAISVFLFDIVLINSANVRRNLKTLEEFERRKDELE